MKSPYSATQIANTLKQVEEGTPVQKACCELGISHVTFYRWRRKFGSTNAAAPAKAGDQPPPTDNTAAQAPLPA